MVSIIVIKTMMRLMKTKALKCVEPKALSGTSRPSLDVMVCPDDNGLNKGDGKRSKDPITNITAIVSPKARPSAKSPAPAIPPPLK